MLDLAEKQRLTHDALRDFTRALPSRAYDVRVIPHKRGCHPATRNWTRAVLLAPDTIKFLRAANADDSDIFIRPGFANYVLVDFDADGDARLKAMLDDGVPVALAVRTSPDHVQAWIDIGPMREVTADEGALRPKCVYRVAGWPTNRSKADFCAEISTQIAALSAETCITALPNTIGKGIHGH